MTKSKESLVLEVLGRDPVMLKDDAIKIAKQYISDQQYDLPYDFSYFVSETEKPLLYDRDTWVVYFSHEPISGHSAVCVDAQTGQVYKTFHI